MDNVTDVNMDTNSDAIVGKTNWVQWGIIIVLILAIIGLWVWFAVRGCKKDDGSKSENTSTTTPTTPSTPSTPSTPTTPSEGGSDKVAPTSSAAPGGASGLVYESVNPNADYDQKELCKSCGSKYCCIKPVDGVDTSSGCYSYDNKPLDGQHCGGGYLVRV